MSFPSLLDRMILGKNTSRQNRDVFRVVILCDLECKAIVPLLNYEFKALNYFSDFFDLHYSDYQSFLTIRAEEIKRFQPDAFIILQDNMYYLDAYQVVFPIEEVEAHVKKLESKLAQVLHVINGISRKPMVITTTLPYNDLFIRQYVSLQHRERFKWLVNDFTRFIHDSCEKVQILDVSLYQGPVIEQIYKDHNSIASLEYLNYVSVELIKILRVFLAKTIKCVITDLDNTLWDGVMADAVPDEVFTSKKARFFFTYQKYLSFLYQQGIILCIVSKNDEQFIKGIFEQYKDVLQIKWDQFVVKQINWEPKSSNIKHICDSLNISEEHVLFIDDSHYECEEVKFNLPKLSVFPFFEDMQENINQLIEADFFRKQQITETDYLRNQTYNENFKREAFKKTIGNEDDFLKSINITLSFTAEASAHIDRISDLSLRTNQFNMTNVRMGIPEVKSFLNNPGNRVLVFSCSDSFGDYGVIGCVFLSMHEGVCTIDNFVMSCRVFGRQVEYAIVDVVLQTARKQGIVKVVGMYKETVKNKKFESFYRHCGFVQMGSDPVYEFRLNEMQYEDKHPYVTIKA